MEQIYNALKNFILESLPDYLEQAESEDTPMPKLQEKSIVFGSVDLSRITSKVICAIVPESQNEREEELGFFNLSSDVVVTFLFQKDKYDVLVRQMSRYASAFRQAILDDPMLRGEVENVEIGARNFFTDAGTTEQQMTAVEIELTILTENQIPLE